MVEVRRLMRLPITFNVMLAFLRGKITIDRLDLPDDVDVIDVQEDWVRRCFMRILESPNFPPVRDGEIIPELPPMTLRSVDR